MCSVFYLDPMASGAATAGMPRLAGPTTCEPVGQPGTVQDQLLPVLPGPLLVQPWRSPQAQMIDPSTSS